MFVFVSILIFYLLANIPFIDRLIIPKRVKEVSVYNKAIKTFVHSGVYKTKSNTGILLFFSVLERKIQIIAELILELSDFVQSISSTIGLVEDIAEQTNLLALKFKT